MSLTCPVCGKLKKDPVDCARHMFGTGDKPHKAWFSAQGLSYIDLLLSQATEPGNKAYIEVGELIVKAKQK